MIPKVIHYCWFGHNPKSELVQRCIKSWKMQCPDYEIVEWNEDNFDIHLNEYVREAYEAKKWAFVTDVARLWIIYHYGGIYLDTDVEMIRSFDALLNQHAFLGSEDQVHISTGLGFGAEKNNPIIKMMLDDYRDVHFFKPDGSYDLTPCPDRNTKAVEKELSRGKLSSGLLQLKDATIYPKEYFCPLDADGIRVNKTQNTYSIHWFSASWLSHDEQIVHEYRLFTKKCQSILGKKAGIYAARIIYLFHPHKRSALKRM